MPDWSALVRAARRATDTALLHLLPSRCFACEKRLAGAQHLGACGSCWQRLIPRARLSCARCALPCADPDTCEACAERKLPVDAAVAAVLYDGVARRFLLRAKNEGRPELLRALARQLAVVVWTSALAHGADAVIAVPSTALSRLRRGFEPGRLLAAEVARCARLPLVRALKRRELAGPNLKALTAAERWQRSQGLVRTTHDLSGLRLLLVDDVLTTGATVSACASALRRAGAAEVRVAVWARTPRPRDGF